MSKDTKIPGKKYASNPNFKFLNTLVDEYLETRSQKILDKILKNVDGLIFKVMYSYNFYSMSPVIVEDVIADCKSRVIDSALKTYDKTKGSFSTHYFWKLRSFVAYRKRYYTQRYPLLHGSTIDAIVDEKENVGRNRLCDIITKSNKRSFQVIKRHIDDILHNRFIIESAEYLTNG